MFDRFLWNEARPGPKKQDQKQEVDLQQHQKSLNCRANQVFSLCHGPWSYLQRGHIMPSFFFSRIAGVTTEIYQEVFKDSVKPWTGKIAEWRPMSSSRTLTRTKFKGDLGLAAPQRSSSFVVGPVAILITLLESLVPFFLAVEEAKNNKHAYNAVDFLRAPVMPYYITVDKHIVARVCH